MSIHRFYPPDYGGTWPPGPAALHAVDRMRAFNKRLRAKSQNIKKQNIPLPSGTWQPDVLGVQNAAFKFYYYTKE
jgi:hypothetical protein